MFSSPPTIRVRKLDFPFRDEAVPRWWFWDNPMITHASNGLNLLFPKGEQFFIRSVKHYLDEIDDPALLERVKGFFGQEGRHGHEHKRANEILEEHGYDILTFLDLYERVAFEKLEPAFPPSLRLATTVALEHFTASMAQNALTADFVEGAHPIMQRLIRWHAAEEIEHKSVAFDVFQTVDGRYWIRVLGLLVATSQLLGWWLYATRFLMEQEELTADEKRRYREEAKVVRGREAGVDYDLVRRAFVDYLRRDFHPDQTENYELARAYLDSVGAA